MTNEEIDQRLKLLDEAISHRAGKLMRLGQEPISRELELLNMSMMAVFVMLGEIAKRLPEKKE